jgi:hypothetical protein
LSVATKVSYGGKKYLVTWHSVTKKAMVVETWIDQGSDGHWREVWSSSSPKPKSSLIAAIIATADAKVSK